tara:strand:+ start:49 stop:672 length:624 start_codon:yes stop_codon:yes gene_type:complete
MVNKIFIGGFGGVGSRLVPQILKQLDFYVGEETDKTGNWDFGASNGFVQIFDSCFQKQNFLPLFNFIDTTLKNPTHFAIKHGHLMFIFNQLKTQHPGCKTIYIMRNPIDAALKLEYIPHFKYGKIPLNDLEAKIQYYIDESIRACEKADLVIKYEDLCFDLENQINIIRKFTGATSLNLPQINIKPSSTIGIGKKYYNKFDMSKLGY